jgi:hypothetical protein
MILTAFLWNLFPLATHTLMDLVLETKTNLVDTETWQALVGSPVVQPTAATNHTLSPATSPLTPDPSVDPWATTVQTVGNSSWAVSLLFPTKPVYEDPTTLMVFLDLVRAVIVWDMVFFFVHIWLHKPWAMQRFHYMHHQVHVCHSIIIYTVHLLDGLFNFAAIAVAPMILEYLSPSVLGMHPLSVALFYVFVGTLGGSSHSGYDTSSDPPATTLFITFVAIPTLGQSASWIRFLGRTKPLTMRRLEISTTDILGSYISIEENLTFPACRAAFSTFFLVSFSRLCECK